MTDDLANLIEHSRGHQMTEAERDAQAVSFAYGNLALDQPNTSRATVQKTHELIKQRTQWMKNYYRVSREYDRLQRLTGSLAGCVFGLLVLIVFLLIRR